MGFCLWARVVGGKVIGMSTVCSVLFSQQGFLQSLVLAVFCGEGEGFAGGPLPLL